MNYLAHARLSFDRPAILLGNMVSDFIKGRKQYDFPPWVQKGIRLHRAIDSFTDIHPSTQEIKQFFKPYYRLYSGAFTDIVYDYFLANDKNEFRDGNALKLFCDETYTSLEAYIEWQPLPFRKMFPYMKEQNWLYYYRYDSGIEKSFTGMVSRARYIHESRVAFELFLKNKAEMRKCYNQFYPSVKNFAMMTLDQLSAE